VDSLIIDDARSRENPIRETVSPNFVVPAEFASSSLKQLELLMELNQSFGQLAFLLDCKAKPPSHNRQVRFRHAAPP
jgi:hypothetical protein